MGRTACTEPQYLYKGALYLFFLLQNYTHQPEQEHVETDVQVRQACLERGQQYESRVIKGG